MKFASIASAIFLLAATSTAANIETVSYSGIYDNAQQDFSVIACAEWAAYKVVMDSARESVGVARDSFGRWVVEFLDAEEW